MTDAPSASTTQIKPQSDKPSTIRLVIRAEILPVEPARTPVPQHLNRRVLVVIVGAAALLALTWIGIIVFKSEPEDVETPVPRLAPASREAVTAIRAESSPISVAAPGEAITEGAVSVEPESTQAKMPGPEAQDAPGVSPSPIDEVLPNPSGTALQTIRGTIRVSVRVTIDKQGTVIAATPEDPGPSRYFERLSVEAAKKWTFAPVNREAQRTMLLRFHFTREGATARVDN